MYSLHDIEVNGLDLAEVLECEIESRAGEHSTLVILSRVTEEEFVEHGVNIVIYANQLTRSAFPAMQDTATKILQCHRAKEVDESLMSIKDIITLID